MTQSRSECFRSELPSTVSVTRLSNVLKLTRGGNKVALLNCEDGIVSMTADSKSIIAHFQEDDILMTFYRNMLTSSPVPDLKATLAQLSISLLLKLLPLLSENSLTRSGAINNLSRCLQIIEETVEESSFKLSIKNTVHLRSVISAVISPKLSKVFSYPKQRFLISLVLEAYISCISSNNFPNIRLITSGHCGDVTDSHFYHGIVFPLQRTSDYKDFPGKENLSVVVFSCCIPQELESYEGETFTFVNMNTDLENVLVKESIKLIEDFLQSRTVNVVCCQKVVHHRVKTFLESKGIMVLERLSVMYAEDLATLCGTSLSPSIGHWNIGFVKCVQQLEVGGKKFLHFQPTDTTHFGVIILHSLTKCISEEMELCINQSLLSCNNALSTQSLVHGSSCLYSTLLSRLSLESHDSVIRAVSATLSELCSKENTLVCCDGHVWELEETPSEDNLISDRCLCRSYRAVGDLNTENFTPLSDYTTSVTYKQTDRQTYKQSDKRTPLTLEYEQENDKVLHPTNVVLEVFRKAFQILEVLCQSELPVLV